MRRIVRSRWLCCCVSERFQSRPQYARTCRCACATEHIVRLRDMHEETTRPAVIILYTLLCIYIYMYICMCISIHIKKQQEQTQITYTLVYLYSYIHSYLSIYMYDVCTRWMIWSRWLCCCVSKPFRSCPTVLELVAALVQRISYDCEICIGTS